MSEMAGRPSIAQPTADTSFLGRLSNALSSLYPGFLSSRTISHGAPRVHASADIASRDFSGIVSHLAQLPDAERREFFISRAQRDAQGPAAGSSHRHAEAEAAAQTMAGQGGGETDNTVAVTKQKSSYGSTATDFKTAVNDSAVCSMLQLGELQRRLEHKKAMCAYCDNKAGVLDTCLCVHGELLCFSCDGVRHAASPCARTRHALLRIGRLRHVLVALHANDWINVPGGSPVIMTGVIGDASWICRRGKSGYGHF